MQIDPDKALKLAQRDASILLLDVPAGTRVGLDHQVRMYLLPSRRMPPHAAWHCCTQAACQVCCTSAPSLCN